MFSLSMDQVVEEERSAALQAKFLHRLNFLAMSDRQEEIADSHKATFHWLYTTLENQPWDDFTEWLQNGNGLYWVTRPVLRVSSNSPEGVLGRLPDRVKLTRFFTE